MLVQQVGSIFFVHEPEWGVNRLSFETDPEPIWTARDNAVRNLCLEKNVQCIESVSHTLWDSREIIEKNGGTPPLTFGLFNLVTSTIGEPPKPVEDVDFSSFTIPVNDDHDNSFAIPTLEKLGICGFFLMNVLSKSLVLTFL
ncbi:hypothetical protein KUTeg_007978 [Tegillarca granosa]|uniref:Photolyase/cryptochrome alpha/beta domain-containing protein n=1 Tax=Tegillarca granosa TaxID=220873 RepID=A0ABQ9FER1_TEGGR|nr:hypothetical protein KUTeg_007978 [Tegillarca granosa]